MTRPALLHVKLCAILALTAAMPTRAGAVSMTTGPVDGVNANIWTWTDASGQPRSVALKQEGNGNSGHGGYAVQFTYVSNGATVTVTADSGGDGGFGYFVSHERYRNFADGANDTIASHIFHKDDSPLGRGFAATTSFPATPAGTGAERFTINYGHYGTIVPDPVNPNTGGDTNPLPEGASNYAFYTMPATTTWVFQDGQDYPRLDVSVSLATVIPPGGTTTTADLVSFDMRGPYGYMVFDNSAGGIVNAVSWADEEYIFKLTKTPVTRNSTWVWNTLNKGARFQALTAGGYEMGLFEPKPATSTQTTDGYSPERGYTSTKYKNSGGKSYGDCGTQQILPSDDEWPYQSVQFSLPCGAGQNNMTTNGQKIAWGTAPFYGTSLTSAYNGQKSFPLNGFPASHVLSYGLCLVLGQPGTGVSLTLKAAQSYGTATPKPDCASTPVP